GRVAYFTEWKEKFNNELKELLKSIEYKGEDNLAYGTSSYAIGIRSYAIGTNALTAGIDSVTLGSNSATFGNGSNSIGERNYTKGNKDQVFGVENIIVGENNLVFGNHNLIHSNNNVILGSNIINTDVNNAVVIGNGSKAIENAVSIGNDTTTRQIKYVKAGTDDTDAVNVKQLKDYVAANSKGLENINAKSNLALSGVANAIAMSSMTQPREGLLNITGAYGTYGGEHALAVGISGNTERFSYKLGVSTNMRGNVGVGLGFGMTVVSSTKDDVIKRMEKKILEYMKESKEQN
ncbi:YadA-like family protein, partial [Sneathia sp. DSM 16630]|nr:YadA-like family protein [Sneathia sp. DSM 16630]